MGEDCLKLKKNTFFPLRKERTVSWNLGSKVPPQYLEGYLRRPQGAHSEALWNFQKEGINTPLFELSGFFN
jgi:hypothetical protein